VNDQVIGWEPATGRRWFRRPTPAGTVLTEAEIVRRLKAVGEFWRKVDAGEIVVGAPPDPVRR
jgi:hypothetical protein